MIFCKKTRTPVTPRNIHVGAHVMRGPAWDWGDQDKNVYGNSMVGIIEEKFPDNWVLVRWSNNTIRGYRTNRPELVYVSEEEVSEIQKAEDARYALEPL